MTSPQCEPQVLFTRKEVAAAVKRLAAEIKRDYAGKNPVLIGILKGSFIFMADLIRLLDFPLTVEFVTLSSYGSSTESSGKIKLVRCLQSPVKGRDVLVIEDIVDTGLTIAFLLEYLRKRKPASLKLCSLLEKPARRKAPVTIDYLGFTVPNKFIVGYGIDWNERYRHLSDICYLEPVED
ncbi:MAG: hypoxanthine phosphoribosyltransferase [Chloroflexi bacterium]|nr:hypoxanthine phosphoribosyltransferase [Chloroflexota bacterium]